MRQHSGRSGSLPDPEENLSRVRRICSALTGTSEKLSHGEPTFFVKKGVYAMFDNNHHEDGHVGVWIPAAPGVQETLVATRPEAFFRPPYVGVKGWVGVELAEVDDEELAEHLQSAWGLVTSKKTRSSAAKKRAR